MTKPSCFKYKAVCRISGPFNIRVSAVSWPRPVSDMLLRLLSISHCVSAAKLNFCSHGLGNAN